MIQRLRTSHRNMFLVLAVLLPGLLVGGLLSRHKSPVVEADARKSLNGNFLTEQTIDLDGRKVTVDLYTDKSEAGSVRFVPQDPLVAPDVVVYWSEVNSPSTLPSDARLLGSFSPIAKYRPPSQGQAGAYLILY